MRKVNNRERIAEDNLPTKRKLVNKLKRSNKGILYRFLKFINEIAFDKINPE